LTDRDVEEWADVGPFCDTATVASILGVTVAAVRSRRARGSLLAMRTGSGAWVYPVWPFDGDVLPGLAKVLRVLSVGNVSGWTVATWLRTPEAEFDGRTPLEVLRAGGEEDLILLVASHAAAGWA